MTPEQIVKRQISEWLQMNNTRCLFTIHLQNWGKYKSAFMRRGWPDISGSWDGKPLWIEVKRPKDGVIRLEQAALMKEARKQGWIAILATCLEDVQKVLI